MKLTTEQKIKLRAAVNDWISETFPIHRMHITHNTPEYSHAEQAWVVCLTTKKNGKAPLPLGCLALDSEAYILDAPSPASVITQLDPIIQQRYNSETNIDGIIVGDGYEFRLGDGVEGSKLLKNQSIDLLLTDPPYGISNPYVCETQISRRLRNDGSDFIMPKGSFGDWDNHVNPKAWTDAVLPKVGGWAVIFCAQAQIGEYCDILKQHKFVAVGPMVWQKTNPVPFNHKYKPVNAWEAIVIGKRPGTKFNGHVVHNVFTCKSPSPQERIHPTQKPLPLLKEFVELFSGQGELVLDPFAGSATTVIAALEANRLVIAYEKDGEIYQQASNRIANRVTRLRLC